MPGVEAVQPSTLLAGSAIFVLLYNALAAALPRRAPGPWPPPVAAECAREARLQAAVARRVRTAGDAAAQLVAVATALVARRLSGAALCLQGLHASACAPACRMGRTSAKFVTAGLRYAGQPAPIRHG